MREWLKKAANPVERDDLQRHDKWLCMMWPRLQLLKELLAEDGAIFVSIDDNEVHRLRDLLDEVWGEDNFVATFIWEKRTTRENRRVFSFSHDFILCYASNKMLFEEKRGELPMTEDVQERYSNPDNDPRGDWQSVSLNAQAGHATKAQFYEITLPSGRKLNPPEGRCWSLSEPRFKELVADNRVWFGPKGDNAPRLKKFLANNERGLTPHTLWKADEVGTTDSATKHLISIVGNAQFPTPKSVELIQRILEIATDKDSLILDSFAGSGTTAHAVLALNAKDGGKRRFILCETEAYADTLTAERVRRVIRGYDYTGTQETELHPPERVTWTTFGKDKNRNEILERIEGIETLERGNYDKIEKKITDGVLTIVGQKQVKEKMPGLGGSFTYLELGEAMDLERLLAETPGTLPSFPALARYLFFTATGHTLPAADTPAAPKPSAKAKGKAKAQPAPVTVPTEAPVLIGETAVWRIYLHYRPDEAWLRSPAAAFTRTQAEAIAATSNGTGKQALVFAAAKFINHRSLRELKVDFAQLPYALHRVQAE